MNIKQTNVIKFYVLTIYDILFPYKYIIYTLRNYTFG